MNPYIQNIIDIENSTNEDVGNNTTALYNRLNIIENKNIRNYLENLIEFSESFLVHPPIPYRTFSILHTLESKINAEFDNFDNMESFNKREINKDLLKDNFIMVREYIKKSILNDFERRKQITENLISYIDEGVTRFDTYKNVLPLSVLAYSKVPKEQLNNLDPITKRAANYALPLSFRSRSKSPKSKSKSKSKSQSKSKSKSKSKGGSNNTRKQQK